MAEEKHFLAQSRFPRLWLLMQHTIGGTPSKQAMATEHYRGHKRVLEIGCSVGNVSAAFRKFSGISFVGIDIDESAIRVAQRRFMEYRNFRFLHKSLSEVVSDGEKFDYVLFAGILHHVDDATAVQLLKDSARCLSAGGIIVISEPDAVRRTDPLFMRCFYALMEQGDSLRSKSEIGRIVEQAGLTVCSSAERPQSLGLTAWPHTARFALLTVSP